MKLNFFLLATSAPVLAKECCEFVAIAAYGNAPKTSDGHYRHAGFYYRERIFLPSLNANFKNQC